MKRHTRFATAVISAGFVITGSLWLAGPLSNPVHAGDPGQARGGGPHANPVFAHKVSGTWLALPGQPGQILININADGTMMWFGTWFYGAGTGNFMDGPIYGVWKQTGPLEITTHELGFLFDGDGIFEATGRVKQVITFSPDFRSFAAAGEEDLFSTTEDPTDPNAVPFHSFSFSYGPAHKLGHMD